MSNSKKSYNTARKKKRTIAAFLAAGYLAGVILGCFVVWLIPYVQYYTDLPDIAVDKGEQLLSAGQMDDVMLYGMEQWFFDESGRTINHESSFLHTSQWREIRDYVPDVLEKGHLFRPTFFRLDNRGEDPQWIFGIICGQVVESSSGRQFVSILLRDQTNLHTTMLTYAALYSILYFVGCFFVYITIKKERELFRMRRDLIANVSHELKTPITAIRAMAETLHDGMVKDENTKRSYSGKIIEESDKLEQLVLDILELSRLQSNRTEFKKAPIYADGLVPPVIDRYMMLCGDLGITLDTSGLTLTGMPPLHTDSEKAITLIEILMDNAVKFTGQGGTIWVSNQIHSKHTTFCIRDNGPGIRAEDVPRIFERFYKADVAHNSSGSGLGLAIAEEIARGLEEKLWVKSEYGSGAAFFFTINFSNERITL